MRYFFVFTPVLESSRKTCMGVCHVPLNYTVQCLRPAYTNYREEKLFSESVNKKVTRCTITEMRENDFGRRSDRSYLCLVAIYVIHALLLNVFLQPQIDVRSSVILSASYIRGSSWYPERNSNATSVSGDIGAKAMSYSPALNSTDHAERRKLVDDDYSAHSSTSAFLQPQPNGAAIRFLAASRASGVSGITNNVLDVAKRTMESLSPAALGILAGCLVFLLTFTENDYV